MTVSVTRKLRGTIGGRFGKTVEDEGLEEVVEGWGIWEMRAAVGCMIAGYIIVLVWTL
jgi:hypothetical protein